MGFSLLITPSVSLFTVNLHLNPAFRGYMHLRIYPFPLHYMVYVSIISQVVCSGPLDLRSFWCNIPLFISNIIAFVLLSFISVFWLICLWICPSWLSFQRNNSVSLILCTVSWFKFHYFQLYLLFFVTNLTFGLLALPF